MSDSLIHSRETVRCAPTVEEDLSSQSAGILRPHPDDACAAEGCLLSPRARPRARGRVFAPSPTILGPFAPQRVAAADRGDVAKGFAASCCLPLQVTMAVRACICTCDCTATVTPTAVGEHEMGSKDSAAKAGGRLEPPEPWRRAAPAPPQPLAPGSVTLHTALMQEHVK